MFVEWDDAMTQPDRAVAMSDHAIHSYVYNGKIIVTRSIDVTSAWVI